MRDHKGLFVHLVDNLIEKVAIFGLYFASLDIRQDSGIHASVLAEIAKLTNALPDDFAELGDAEKIDALLAVKSAIDPAALEDQMARDTIESIRAIREIQSKNGELACHRYIISHTESALNVFDVFGLFLIGGWKKNDLSIDIVPLFETIVDLKHAAGIMRELYTNKIYRAHLRNRGDKQTIMLGFSDGTKDGGYLMANWSIYRAKDELTALAREFGISVVFFDGRGGPPARGGGKTHKFYSSMGNNIADDSIELTVQGQTVSSNFGTVEAAQFNIEQLLHAGIYNQIFTDRDATFSKNEEKLIGDLADASFRAYDSLKNHPRFLDYLSNVSPLNFYAETNIGSRPAKRGTGKMTLDDLRAIPFVGAWSQLKQNVPGFYGVGSALRELSSKIEPIRELYERNLFFRTLLDNCEMAMQKTDLDLTAFLAKDRKYGAIWKMIRDEFEVCLEYLAKVTGKKDLMMDFPVEQQSVRTRERIVLPLTTIQQYALTKIRTTNDEDLKKTLGKLVVRCSFGIINAGRNSA
jgi:phosphoenolpyruvate carboxylase